MNSVLEVLFLRRPSIDYISCPVCDFDFSSSGGPVIVLEALGRLLAPSGFVLGGRGRFQLSWNHYPGALCYTVYKAVDSNNPNGEYVVVAECIEDPTINLEPEGPGCYRVSAITPNGETELSDPICNVGDCPFIISGATPSAQTVDEGDPFSISSVISNPGAVQSFIWYKDGVPFEDTTATTEEELLVPSATQLNEGNYTLVIEGNGCTDESLPALVTVNEGPLCTHHIELVEFIASPTISLTSEGLVIATNDAGTRPFYHVDNITRDTRTSIDSSPITASQLGTTVTASDAIFALSDEGKIIEFSTSERAQIVTFISPTQVTVTPSQSVGSTTFLKQGSTLGGVLGQGILASAGGILLGTEETFTSAPDQHAFWLDRNTGEIRDLGGPSRTPSSVSSDGYVLINDLTNPADLQVFLYNPIAQTFTNLGDIAGGETVDQGGKNLNNSHIAAVTCNLGPASSEFHACRWAGGIITDIHPAAAGTEDSRALGINESGTIFGEYFHAVDLVDRGFVNQGGASLDIGNSGGGYVNPLDMNDSDAIVGIIEIGSGTGNERAFLWTPGGGMTLIPQLPATTTGSAVSINSDGWIVGTMDGIPFIHRSGITEELFTLIPGGTLWSAFFTVDKIADNGWVTGLGLHDGNLARYLMQLCS